MQAATYDHPGDPSVLHLTDIPDPVPTDTELLIRVEAISIEGGDLIWRKTILQQAPDLLGYAAAGEIIKLGAAVQGFELGQKVTTFANKGSHAELRAVPAATAFLVPDGLDIKTAAAIPVGPGTAAYALHLGNLKPGETVLVTGAAGGVGLATVQLAARAGARVIGTGTSSASLEKLRQYGLSDPIVIGDAPASDQIRTLLGGNTVDLLIDNVGGPALVDALQVLSDGGRAVLVGVFGGLNQPIDAGQILFHRHTIIGCMLGGVMGDPPVRALIDTLLNQARDGDIEVPIDATFPLAQAAAAHRRAEERGRIGRVIMLP